MEKLQFREIKDSEKIDLPSLSSKATFTQAEFYGEWQKKIGRTVLRFGVFDGNKLSAYLQLIKYPLVSGKSYFYAPYGPIVQEYSEDLLEILQRELMKIGLEHDAVFIRLDFLPTVTDRDLLAKYFIGAPGYTYHSAFFQPRTEWFLSLGKTEEEILMAMHEKTRYSIRLASRKGVTAETVSSEFEKYFEIFYQLMLATAKRNGFRLHDKVYYLTIFKNLATIPQSFLSIARLGDQILAIDLIIVYNKVAHYVFGGSTDEEKNRMPAYLAQWQAICHAKAIGCTDYNFGGVASEDDRHSAWEGLTAFKRKFGGREIRHSQFYDLVVKRFWYNLYNLRKLAKSFKK